MSDVTTCPRCGRAFTTDTIREGKCAHCAAPALANVNVQKLALGKAQVRPDGFARLLCGLMTLGVLIVVLLALLPAEDRSTKRQWVFGQLLTVAVLDVVVIAALVRFQTRWCFEGHGPRSIGSAVLFQLCVMGFVAVLVVASLILCVVLASPLW